MIPLQRRIKTHKGSYFFAYVQILSYLCTDFDIIMTKKQVIHIVEWVVAIIAYAYLAYRMATYDAYDALLHSLSTMTAWQWIALLLCLAFMPVNMLVEAWRWRTLMRMGGLNELGNEGMSWVEAQRQVYFSKLAGLITPWRLGEYPARGLMMDSRFMPQVLSMGAVGSATMTMAIVLLGLPALCCVPAIYTALGTHYIYLLIAILILLLVAIYFAPTLLRRWVTVRPSVVWISVAQSLVRLLCWCVQLGLVLCAFEPTLLQLSSLAWIPIYYLLVTITPNIPIVEVGVRGAWAVFIFGSMQAAIAGVVLWVINTLLPCVVWLFLRKKQ